MSGYKTALVISGVVVVLLLILEGTAAVTWTVIDYFSLQKSVPKAERLLEEFHTQHDPELGWSHIPGKRIDNFYGPGRSITINNEGFRGPEDYLGDSPPDRFRVILLGDSFTMGYGVDDSSTYPALLQTFNPAVQAVNMGQGGYSIGQCYLWYRRQGSDLRPDALVLAIILNDIWRLGETRVANGAATPAFVLRKGKLLIKGQPVPKKIPTGSPILTMQDRVQFLILHSSLMRSVAFATGRLTTVQTETRRKSNFRVALAILDALHDLAAMQDVPFVLVLLPELYELTDTGESRFYHEVSASLDQFSHSRGILYLDLLDAFSLESSGNPERLFLSERWRHYSEEGNSVVARTLDSFLRTNIASYPRPKRAASQPEGEPISGQRPLR